MAVSEASAFFSTLRKLQKDLSANLHASKSRMQEISNAKRRSNQNIGLGQGLAIISMFAFMGDFEEIKLSILWCLHFSKVIHSTAVQLSLPAS